MPTILRYLITGDDVTGSKAFDNFRRTVERTDGAVQRQNKTLKQQDSLLKQHGKALQQAGKQTALFASHVTGAGDAFTIFSRKASMATRVMAGLNLATGLALPILSSLVVAMGGLAAATAAAGAGLAAYGIALKPLLGQVSDLNKAQAAAAKASQAAKDQYAKLLKQTPPLVRKFAKEVRDAQTAYKKWADSLAGPVLAPLQIALANIKPALKAIRPLVVAAGDAFTVLMTQLDHKIQGGGIERIVTKLLPAVKPVLIDLGHSIANVFAGIWGIIKAFLPFSTTVSGGLVKMTDAFKNWATTLSGHSGFHAIVNQWKQDWPVIKPVLANLFIFLKNIISSLAAMTTPANSKALWMIANPLMAVAVKLSEHPIFVQALTYLLLIGKGAGRIKSVFDAMKTGWGTFSAILNKLTGGKIGTAMVGAGDTMLLASKNMQKAADTMAAASGLAGKAGGAAAGAGAGAAEAAGAGAAAGSAGRGGLWGKMFGRSGIAAGLARAGGVAVIAGLITDMVLKPVLSSVTQNQRAQTTFWDRPFGTGAKGSSAFESWRQLGRTITGVGHQVDPVIAGMNSKLDTLGRPGGVAPRAANELGRVSGQTSRLGGDMRSAAQPVNDLTKKSQALAQQFMSGLGAQLNRLHANTPRVRTDINNLADAIKTTGDKSKATQKDRQQLIHDLEQSGVKSSTAKTLVNHLTTAINNIPNRHSTYLKFGVNVPRGVLAHYPSAADMRAAGFAAGGPVRGPGGPTDDRAGLFPLSNKEWVIRASSATSYGSKAMDAVNKGTASVIYPGMAAGGEVGDLTAASAQKAPGGSYRIGDAPTETFALKLWQVWIDQHSGGMKAVREAMKWIGQVPYVWGGMNVPGGADCSGFVSYVYGKALGILPPRTSEAQYAWVKRTGPQPGGLAFYTNPGGGVPPGHVALVKDANTVISQGGPGKGPIVIGLHGPGPLMGTGIPPGGFSAKGGPGAGTFGESQLASLWMQAGGARNLSHLMAAIAMAESGGRSNAVGPMTPFGQAKGLWQILGQLVRGNIFDPLVNARNARAKYLTQGLGAWEAYTNGSYRQFMAGGGAITEPVAGVGLKTGAEYMLGEAGTEYVSSQADLKDVAAALRAVLAELRAIRQLTHQQPVRTGRAVGEALNGGARRAATLGG